MIKAAGAVDVYNSLMNDFNSGSLKYSLLKDSAADVLWNMVNGFKEKKAEISIDKKIIKDQIKSSSENIRKIAQETLKEVKEMSGLLNVKF
jgi:tryptophanyl-tRNA synthetase